jgi:septum formation protein
MLVLASRSPRRAELLRAAGLEFTIRATDVDETPHPHESPDKYVLRLAEEKAAAVPSSEHEIVLGADTAVVLDGEILGKPNDPADAVRMLSALAGRRHDVITGVCLRQGNRIVRDMASTAVWFGPISDVEIAWYVDSREPMDKAGAYGIQGLASRFVDRIDGSYSNVVGLPIALVYRMLQTLH